MANDNLSGMSTQDLYKAAAIAEGYESVPVDIDTFLNDPYYLGQIYGEGRVYPYWMDALHKVFPNPLYSPYEEVCLSGDTEVDLLDGTTRTMAQICRDFQGKAFWVLAFNVNTKSWEPCRAGAPKPTGVKPVYHVTLDNGKSFKATGNHKVLGKDNRWYRVDSLKVGQSLMPYNLSYDEKGYAHVWDNVTQKKVKRRRLVQDWKFHIPEGWQVHHKNQVKQDDRPCNLLALPCAVHLKKHHDLWQEGLKDPLKRPQQVKKIRDGIRSYREQFPMEFTAIRSNGGKAAWANRSPETIARMRKAQLDWVNSKEGKELSAEKFREYNKTHKEELRGRAHRAVLARWSDEGQRLVASKKMSECNRDADFQAKAKAARFATQEQRDLEATRMRERNSDPARQLKCRQGKILKNLNRREDLDRLTPESFNKRQWTAIAKNFDCFENGEPSFAVLKEKWASIVERARNYNHRIVSIEELPPEMVFNFTVDRLHNYPLTCGIISSNCVTGCIGAGKTSFALMGALYDLYHVTLLKDPHKKYKLLPTTSIIFSLVTATMDLATAVMANQFLDAMGASPYFCSKFNPKKGERLDEDMFPHHVGIGYGSRGGHNLGKAVIGAIIDEANFQDKVADQAVQNYDTITRRMKSRFMLKGGSLPCRRWLISSRNDSSSFLESHIDAVRNDPSVIIFEPAIWDVQSYKGIYSGKTFPVFIGSDVEQPKVLTTDAEVEDYQGRIIQVPVEYRTEFETNLPGSLQDLAGVATRNGVNLIYNMEALDKSLCLDNCMTTDELHLTLNDTDQIADFYKAGSLPKGKYYVHLDGGLRNDRFGFAMSRVTESIKVDTVSALDGGTVSKISPAVETPLVFGIKALPGSEVPLWKVRVFLAYLRSQGVSIAQVTCDGYQSADMMQLLEKMGFKTKYVSVDKTKDPYLKLSSNILLGLIKLAKSGILRTELMNLQNLPKKIDHPTVIVVDGKKVPGGKDIADAVASSSYEAIADSMTLGASSLVQLQKSVPTHMSMKERQDYVLEHFFKMGV